MSWSGPENVAEAVVPDLVGMLVADARKSAWAVGLVAVAADPDGPPLGALTWPGTWIVTAQRPQPGTVLHYRGSVVVDFEKWSPGDESGDREPLQPTEPPGALHAERDPEESGENSAVQPDLLG